MGRFLWKKGKARKPSAKYIWARRLFFFFFFLMRGRDYKVYIMQDKSFAGPGGKEWRRSEMQQIITTVPTPKFQASWLDSCTYWEGFKCNSVRYYRGLVSWALAQVTLLGPVVFLFGTSTSGLYFWMCSKPPSRGLRTSSGPAEEQTKSWWWDSGQRSYFAEHFALLLKVYNAVIWLYLKRPLSICPVEGVKYLWLMF